MLLARIRITDKVMKEKLSDDVLNMYDNQEEAKKNKPATWKLGLPDVGIGIVHEDGKVEGLKTGFEIWSYP